MAQARRFLTLISRPKPDNDQKIDGRFSPGPVRACWTTGQAFM